MKSEADLRDPADRLRRLDTCAVSDALDSLRLPGAALGLQSVTGSHRFAGRAVTVDLAEAGAVTSPRHLGTAAIYASGAGDVIVVANHGRRHVAGWGGVLSTGARHAGIEGVVVDGAVRDVDEAASLGLPVFALARVPVTARTRVSERAWNVDIQVAGVPVSPGDYVIADGSGVVFVPAAKIDDVLAKAEAIAATERAMVAKIRAGSPMVAVMGADYENLLAEKSEETT